MRKLTALFSLLIVTSILITSLSGCTLIFQKGRRKDIQQISKLQEELTDLERAKRELEQRLQQEISDSEVSLAERDGSLVITFVAEVLFDSGKAELRSDALGKLGKVARVLNTTVRDLNVGIEGHTDNVPIKHSGWKSNWELSAARAMSVLHFLIDEQDLSPVRLSATGFGEYHPVESNDTAQGRQSNRRVEIVILPKVSKEPAVVEDENLK